MIFVRAKEGVCFLFCLFLSFLFFFSCTAVEKKGDFLQRQATNKSRLVSLSLSLVRSLSRARACTGPIARALYLLSLALSLSLSL